ncbi:ABC transporter ATP-binding protein/permease [Anaerostipes hadrus]|nr:ABC transporter ATP-binding protein/permease [Anaerostipes hadrus]
MIEKLMHRYALSRRGAKDLIKGVVACTLQDISFMFPVTLLYLFVKDLLANNLKGKTLFYVIGAVVCLIVVFTITLWQYNSTFLATYVETGTRRITLAEKLRKIPLSFFSKKDLADLTSTIMADCTYLETAFSHFIPPFAGSMISTVIIAISLLFFDVKMAIASLWVLPVAIIIVVSTAKVQQKLTQKSMDAKMDAANGIQECIDTIADLKSNNAEKRYLVSLDDKIDNVEKRVLKNEFGTAVFVSCAQMVLKLGIATTALAGSALLIKGEIDVLTFFVFLLLVSRLYDPMQAALQNLAAIISTKTNVDRMNEILDHDVQSGDSKLTNNGYDITFDNVSFSYNNNEKVLDNVSFTAKQGEITALVGPSGGGKTTVSRLAARFWDATSGNITVGGMNISNVEPETLLSLYSIVFQDVTLFNTSVAENIRLGKKGATDEEVLVAAKLANCDEFVQKLANGYDTEIGENGCNLSGGERQRISIARAFLKNAPIILLDEATASLDVENETLIQTALSKLIENKTVIVIAHRMRTVENADKIVVLSDGKIAECDTPDKLMQKDSIFKHMTELQTASQNWTI